MASTKDRSVQIELSASIKSVISAFDDAGKSLTKFGKQAQNVGESLGKIFNPLMKGLVASVTVISTGMTLVAKSALQVGGDFELSMAMVKGVTSSTTEEFDLLVNKAKEMGQELPVSANDVAKAMYTLASAGFDAGEVLGSIEGIVKLSIAQNYDLAETTDLVTTVIRSFGMAAEDTGKIADIFNNAISTSKLNMDKLNQSITYVAASSHALDFSLESVVAVLAKLADSGLRAEQIGTGARTLITSLIKITPEAAKVLDKLKVSVDDGAGSLRPLSEIFMDLRDAGMTASDAVLIFGKRFFNAALTVAAAADDLAEYEEELRKIGKTQGLLDAQMATWLRKLALVQNAFNLIRIEVFEQIKEKAKELANEIQELAIAFLDWAKETEVFKKVFDALIEGFGFAVGNAKDFGEALREIDVDKLADKFKNFAETTKKLFDAFVNLAKKVPWKFIAEHLEEIATVIVTGWAAGKIALIIGGLSGLGKAFGKFSVIIKKTAEAVGAWNLAHAGMVLNWGWIAGVAGAALGLIALFPTELEEATGSSEDWTLALQGNKEALAKLSEEEQKFVKEKLKEYSVGKVLEEEAVQVESATDRVEQSMRDYLKTVVETFTTESEKVRFLSENFGDDIRQAFASGGKAGVKEFLAIFGKLEQGTKELMDEVVARATEGMDELGNIVVKTTFSQDVSKAIQEALQSYNTYAADQMAKTQELVDTTGINVKEAWAALEVDLKAKAENTSKELTKQFSNPSVGAAFAKAFDDMAKAGGNAMTFRISDSLNNVKSSIQEMSAEAKSAIDGFIAELTTKAPAYANLQLTQVRETVDEIIFMAKNATTSVINIYDKNTKTFKSTAEAMRDTSNESSKLFNKTADEVDAAGRKSRDAWNAGAIEPLRQTGAAAQTAGLAFSAVLGIVESLGNKISTMGTLASGVFSSMAKEVQMLGSSLSTMGVEIDTGMSRITGVIVAASQAIKTTIGDIALRFSELFSGILIVTNITVTEVNRKILTVNDTLVTLSGGITSVITALIEGIRQRFVSLGESLAVLLEQVKLTTTELMRLTTTTIMGIAKQVVQLVAQMGSDMLATLESVMNSFTAMFERSGITSARLMVEAIHNGIRNAIPHLASIAQYAGDSMGRAMGRAMEAAMQRSIQNIAQAIAALERRIAKAKSSASSGGSSSGSTTIDPIKIDSIYATEG